MHYQRRGMNYKNNLWHTTAKIYENGLLAIKDYVNAEKKL